MSRFLKPRYQALEAYVPGEQPRDMEYIKLNTNESPFPPAPEVVAAMNAEQVENLRLYSDPTGLPLKKKLAQLYDLQPENIFLSNGSDDILNFAFMAFADERGAAFADISYGFYPVYGELLDESILNADKTKCSVALYLPAGSEQAAYAEDFIKGRFYICPCFLLSYQKIHREFRF